MEIVYKKTHNKNIQRMQKDAPLISTLIMFVVIQALIN